MEWEYACHAGITAAWYGPQPTANNQETGWTAFDFDVDTSPYYGSENRVMAVGQKLINPWGLYDMLGNVFEWCWDWYGDYPTAAQNNPTGPVGFRLVRD